MKDFNVKMLYIPMSVFSVCVCCCHNRKLLIFSFQLMQFRFVQNSDGAVRISKMSTLHHAIFIDSS